MIVASQTLPIREMRNSFSSGFAEWDLSVERKDRKGAKAARRKMQADAFSFLPKPLANLPGWYVFADLRRGEVHYVGIAKTVRRSMGRRIADRFKDDSCLDVSLDTIPESEQRAIIRGRLLTALPESGSNYIQKHIDAADLVRRSTHVLMVGTDDRPALVEQVEKLLIGAGVAASMSLRNVQHRTLRMTPSDETTERAHEVLDHLAMINLPKRTVDRWRAELKR